MHNIQEKILATSHRDGKMFDFVGRRWRIVRECSNRRGVVVLRGLGGRRRRRVGSLVYREWDLRGCQLMRNRESSFRKDKTLIENGLSSFACGGVSDDCLDFWIDSQLSRLGRICRLKFAWRSTSLRHSDKPFSR